MTRSAQCGRRSGRHVSRRHVLRTALVASAPLLIPSNVFGDADTPGANERVEIGVIGVGIRGKHLIRDMPPSGRVTALCDCCLPRVEEVRKANPDASLAAFADYRAMIDEAKLDAVIVSTPDHHHVHAAILACRAGLDVYCEKPLSLTIGEGQKLVEAVRHNDRVLQVGSQQRSMEMDRFACQFVREGGLGKVSRVEVQNWPGPLADESLPEEPVPEGLHWDLFCGPRPMRPHHWRLWMKDVREWQGRPWRGWDMWRDYSGHLMTNWGAHAVDIAQWALGMDDTGPVEIEPLVEEHSGEMRTCPIVMRYASGTELCMTHPKGFSAGGCFDAEKGQIVIMRNQFRTAPRDLIDGEPGPEAAAVWKGKELIARPHLQNWLECIKGRKEPVAPVEVGHRSATICHLGGIARELGRKLRWDPAAETFPNDTQACALLDRPRRVGWELPDETQ